LVGTALFKVLLCVFRKQKRLCPPYGYGPGQNESTPMTDTPRLALPVIEAAQAQKHVTHNQALVLLDALTQLAVESRTLSAPPASPIDGACYIPASGASGFWNGWDGQIALFSGGGWLRVLPVSGLKAWVKTERLTLTYEDSVWRDGVALTVHGGRVTLRAKEEELTLSGAFAETVDAAFIPDRAIVLGVASRTTLAITGATSYGDQRQYHAIR
jgi:hypothetical protein